MAILDGITNGRDQLLEHVFRHYGLLSYSLEAESGEKREGGRPQLDHTSQTITNIGCMK